MKVKDIPNFLISQMCSRKKNKIINEGISAGFYFHEFNVLAKIAKNKTLWKKSLTGIQYIDVNDYEEFNYIL